MSLATPEKIRKLQRGLYEKAKREPTFRFYMLYDKVYRKDILEHSLALVRVSGGGPGVDGQTFKDIEAYGAEKWLDELGKELKEKTYRPQVIKRVQIPKANGGKRALGIPTVRDRVAQRAALLVLEPIFEADLDPNAYGYRPGKSALDAVQEVHRALLAGHREVIDADLSSYFDTIPHKDLLEAVARRVSDKHILHLIKLWLKATVQEKDDNGNTRLRSGKKRKEGVPQGGVISPLLANIYMDKYLKSLRRLAQQHRLSLRFVNYADDFVVLCRTNAARVLDWTRRKLAALGLRLNEEKTRIVRSPAASFDFLGYTFGSQVYRQNGFRYLGAAPSKKSEARLKASLSAILRKYCVAPWEVVVERLNRTLRGWQNYFSYGTTSAAYKRLSLYVFSKVRFFLRHRHKVQSHGTRQYSWNRVHGELGLLQLDRRSDVC